MDETKPTTKTVTIHIGNSDDKLSQKRWAAFCRMVLTAAKSDCVDFWGVWYSQPQAPWQNMCCAAECMEDKIPELKQELDELRQLFNQDSIAVLIGTTEFIGPTNPVRVIDKAELIDVGPDSDAHFTVHKSHEELPVHKCPCSNWARVMPSDTQFSDWMKKHHPACDGWGNHKVRADGITPE